MIYELRSYTLRPGTQPEFLRHAGEVGLRIRGSDYGRLEGYWSSEIGVLNQIFHLWSFASAEQRTSALSALGQLESWQREYLPKARSMSLTQETTLLNAALPIDPPPDAPNLYELRRYTLHPGKFPEWLALLKETLEERRKLSRIVGVWSTDVGTLNQVVHIWSYRDLNERASIRARATAGPKWKDFLVKVPSLVMRMESTILNPSSFSPMK
jgi:hypothetical protein